MLLTSILEIIVVIAVIIAVFNEPKIANWEQKMFCKIKRWFKLHICNK